MSVSPRLRHTRHNPCRVCGGWDDSRLRGHGLRCFGFDSDDLKWCICTREQHAGALPFHENSQGYTHRMEGECKCGIEHAPAPITPPSDLRPTRRQRYEYRMPEGTIECFYVYYGIDGKPKHRTVRYRDPKDFRQQRYDNGQWRWGLAGTATVLYHLPEILAAAPSELVWFCEGEKDADRLAELGLLATCVPNNATWREQYGEWLTGRSIVICADNDDAGRLHAASWSRHLVQCARTVQVISFDALPEKADVSDWLDAGGTVNALVSAIPDRRSAGQVA